MDYEIEIIVHYEDSDGIEQKMIRRSFSFEQAEADLGKLERAFAAKNEGHL